MRIFIRGAVALVILVAAYWGWALAGTAQLASAAQRGDAAAVMERVDITSLSRSLSGQISRAYLEQNPELQKLLQAKGITDGVGLNAAAAEMLLRAFLTPENIAAILNRGSAGLPNVGGADAGGLQMPALGEAFRAAPLKAVLNSHFVSPAGFVVGLDSPDGLYGVHMNLSGTTWRLSGVDIPDAVTARVARMIAQRLNGALDLRGG
jgi:hypothetical protein